MQYRRHHRSPQALQLQILKPQETKDVSTKIVAEDRRQQAEQENRIPGGESEGEWPAPKINDATS